VTELLDVARRQGESVRAREVGPTGVPELEPLVLLTDDETTAFYPDCSPDTLSDVLRDDDISASASFSVSHDADQSGLPVPDDGPLSVGTRRTLDGCGWLVPDDVAGYREYADELGVDADSLISTVADAGLQGRGRGDARTDDPVGETWKQVADAAGDPVVVVNANEADEHARMDQLLLESVPLTVLDPAAAAAKAVGATDVVVYVNETDDLARRRIQQAAVAFDDETDVDVQVVAGPDEYKAGEMTMALEALEGNDRIEARRRPPGPEEHGLHGRPTLVHTPRTFAQVAAHLREGSTGADEDPGTRLFTVTGDGARTATVELPTDASLSTLETAAGVDEYKAACVGGVFGGFAPDLDVRASADPLADERLGTNGVVEFLADDRCLLAEAGSRAKFAHDENCGRCVPCREGSKQLTELLRAIYDGSYDSGKVAELARVMESTSLCDFGVLAARPTRTAMTHFESEFITHAGGSCLSGDCDADTTEVPA
jgi:NADH-quinone oxidoreductase subunit F